MESICAPRPQDLEAGLNQAAKENGYELVFTSGEFDVAKQKDQAFRTAEDILQAHPDLDGIFGINDDSALGALAVVQKPVNRAA
jgi:ABC-type sugar transport system substrate-binding protein